MQNNLKILQKYFDNIVIKWYDISDWEVYNERYKAGKLQKDRR